MSDSPFVVDVNAENFQQAVVEKSREVPVMVDFWAPWCGPCKTLGPMVEKLANEYGGKFILAKVNVDENQELAMHFGARSIPTVKLVKDAAIVDEFVGALPESQIREMLERHVGAQIEGEAEQVESTIVSDDTDDPEEAIRLLHEQLANEEKADSRRMLVRLLLQGGNVDEAQAEFDKLNEEDQLDDESKKLKAMLHFSAVGQTIKDAHALIDKVNEGEPNTEELYQAGCLFALQGSLEHALTLFMHIVKTDRQYNDDAGRKAVLMILDMMGSDNPAASKVRRQLFTLLH